MRGYCFEDYMRWIGHVFLAIAWVGIPLAVVGRFVHPGIFCIGIIMVVPAWFACTLFYWLAGEL